MTVPCVGLDLSTAATGIASADGTTRTIRPEAGANDPARRLHQLVERISSRIAASRPLLAVIEGYGFNTQRLAPVAELGGAIRLRLFDMGVPYIVIAPPSLKLFATGNGHATKDQMVAAAREHGGNPANDDEADAWLLWLAAQQRYEPHHDRPRLTSTLLNLPWPELRWVAA